MMSCSKYSAIVFVMFTLALYSQNEKTTAKFEPKDGECLVFIGQDLEAIGGLKDYNEGYTDYFETPAGITIYTNFSPNTNSFGYINKGNDGLTSKTNWGAGNSYGDLYLKNQKFDNSILAIGLSFVDNEKQIAKGKHDALIIALAEWIKNTKRPVFIRIGYEFDGWDWNHYNRKYYLKAWKHIHQKFEELNVTNVAFVWQSKGNGSNQDILEEWYPGNDIVDWCAYSYFSNPDKEMLTFARKHNKPVFIAEATPVMETDGLFFNSQLTNPEVAKNLWNKWFTRFFETINENSDVIKAFSYINSDWSSQAMWINNPVFQKVDSRIQMSDYVSKLWKAEINKPKYLKASAKLFQHLQNHSNHD